MLFCSSSVAVVLIREKKMSSAVRMRFRMGMKCSNHYFFIVRLTYEWCFGYLDAVTKNLGLIIRIHTGESRIVF